MVKELEAIWDRLRRAEEHLEAIKQELLAYYNSAPGQITGKYQPDQSRIGGEGEWDLKLDPLPIRLNTLIGEFLHNLRSALDHLVWRLVLDNGGKPTKETTFPILRVGNAPNKKGKQAPPRIAGGVSADALTLIEAAQPYQFGTNYADSALWVLHQLWNIDKHRHVIARGGNFKAFFPGRDIPPFSFTARFDSATEYGAKFALIPDDPKMDVNAYATIEVTLHEPEHGIEGPILRTLEDLLQSVVRMVTTAEDRCF